MFNIIEKESECDFLRALLKSPQFGLPEYTADPIVQRRVGRAVVEASTQPHSRPILLRYVDALPNTTREKNLRSGDQFPYGRDLRSWRIILRVYQAPLGPQLQATRTPDIRTLGSPPR